MEGRKTELKESSTFEIPINVMHEVTGVTDAIFIVIKEKA
jgi:quercetin dioxygenase-like cupin family protein